MQCAACCTRALRHRSRLRRRPASPRRGGCPQRHGRANFDQNGAGPLANVILSCPSNTPASAVCGKSWTAIGGTHTINWSGSTLLEYVDNATGHTWTDYHFAFQGLARRSQRQKTQRPWGRPKGR